MAENLLAAAMTTLTATLQEYASDAAVYRRDGQAIDVRVVRGKSLLRLSDDGGNQKTELWDNDFFIPVGDLVLAGKATKPLGGDLIEIALAGQLRRYEVMRPAADEPCGRLVDQDTAWRVHAKYLEERDA